MEPCAAHSQMLMMKFYERSKLLHYWQAMAVLGGNFKSVLSYNLYISTVFRSVSWLMKIMRAAHFLKHYVCKEKSWQRELHFLWHPFNFHILFKFGEENGGNPLNTNASCERGSASYD